MKHAELKSKYKVNLATLEIIKSKQPRLYNAIIADAKKTVIAERKISEQKLDDIVNRGDNYDFTGDELPIIERFLNELAFTVFNIQNSVRAK